MQPFRLHAIVKCGGFGIAVMPLGVSTMLLYVEPG